MGAMKKASGTCVNVEYVQVGWMTNNVFIISDGEGLFVVDPSCEIDSIMEALGDRKVDAIVLTHRHSDHVGAAKELREKTGATVIASKADAPIISGRQELYTGDRPFVTCPVDYEVEDGDILQIGNMAWKVLVTPGHTEGSMCLFIDPEFGIHRGGAPVLISGDTLFNGTTGRVDFPGGSARAMAASMKRLAFLPDNTVVLPGHEALTTVGRERRVFRMFGDEPEE